MSSLPTPTILICDDEPNLRELMGVTLGDRYWCIEADDVAQSIELAQRLRPDLVLVDVMMPGGSGHDRAPGGRRMRDALVAGR
jgi:putative two-component system response regulator